MPTFRSIAAILIDYPADFAKCEILFSLRLRHIFIICHYYIINNKNIYYILSYG
jgi:hypothetical protein